MALNIGKEIAELKRMTVRELREKYEAVFGEPTRAGNKDFLFKRIAWRIQSLAEGDLSERARRRAEFLARDADLRTTAPRAPQWAPAAGCGGGSGRGGRGCGAGVGGSGGHGVKPTPSLADERVPPPGTVLTRMYRGQAYHVVVRDDGFEYDGQVFRSLSAIAKLITGSHWNGLLFFKITKPKTGQVTDSAKPKAAQAADAATPKKKPTDASRLTAGRASTAARPKRRREAVHA
jgi:hypothetical protein